MKKNTIQRELTEIKNIVLPTAVRAYNDIKDVYDIKTALKMILCTANMKKESNDDIKEILTDVTNTSTEDLGVCSNFYKLIINVFLNEESEEEALDICKNMFYSNKLGPVDGYIYYMYLYATLLLLSNASLECIYSHIKSVVPIECWNVLNSVCDELGINTESIDIYKLTYRDFEVSHANSRIANTTKN